MGWNYLSIPKLQRCNRWSLGMDKLFHPTLYQACNYLSMLGLKLNHVSKRGHWSCATSWSFARLPYMSLPMGQKLFKLVTFWVWTLRNTYFWNIWMDLLHSKFYAIVATCSCAVSCHLPIYDIYGVAHFSPFGPYEFTPWASYQIRNIAGCACAGNAGNVFPHRWLQRKTAS